MKKLRFGTTALVIGAALMSDPALAEDGDSWDVGATYATGPLDGRRDLLQ